MSFGNLAKEHPELGYIATAQAVKNAFTFASGLNQMNAFKRFQVRTGLLVVDSNFRRNHILTK